MTEYNLRDAITEPIRIETAYLWNWEKMDLRLSISDGRLHKTDDAVYLFATCSSGIGFKYKENVKWSWEKNDIKHLMLKFHTKSREETDYKTKEKKTIDPSSIEKYMEWVAENFEGMTFNGHLMLMDTPKLNIITTGRDGNEIISIERRSMMSEAYADFRIAANPEASIWTDSLIESVLQKTSSSKTAYKSGYTASKGQTEYERLKDREKWLVEAVNSFYEQKVTSLADVFAVMSASNENGETNSPTIRFLMDVMSR